MYQLISIEHTSTPDGMEGRDWCRYVIAQDSTEIVGYRQGTVQQVTEHAKEYLEKLNSRTTGYVNTYRSSAHAKKKAASKT
jgi:hypothetical protein